MSLNLGYTTWRRSTPSGVKYKLMEGYPRGGRTMEQGWHVEEKWIIRSVDLISLLSTIFPRMVIQDDGNHAYTSGLVCPSYPDSALIAWEASYEPFIEGRPMDPEGTDPGAPDGTYGEYVVLTITFKPILPTEVVGAGEGDEDMSTYLEVSADTSAETLVVEPSSKAVWASTSTPVEKDVSIPLLCPQTEWTISFPHMTLTTLAWYMSRGRGMLGYINSVSMALLAGASPGTILFTGTSVRRSLTYDSASTNQTFQLTLKFLEKPQGHNYFFNKATFTWDRIVVNGKYAYGQANLNRLWGSY